MIDNDNLEEYTPEPLGWWDWLHLAVLGLVTVLWIALLWKIGGWVVWLVKGVLM